MWQIRQKNLGQKNARLTFAFWNRFGLPAFIRGVASRSVGHLCDLRALCGSDVLRQKEGTTKDTKVTMEEHRRRRVSELERVADKFFARRDHGDNGALLRTLYFTASQWTACAGRHALPAGHSWQSRRAPTFRNVLWVAVKRSKCADVLHHQILQRLAVIRRANEALVEALVGVGKPVGIQAHQVQDRRLQVAN